MDGELEERVVEETGNTQFWLGMDDDGDTGMLYTGPHLLITEKYVPPRDDDETMQAAFSHFQDLNDVARRLWNELLPRALLRPEPGALFSRSHSCRFGALGRVTFHLDIARRRAQTRITPPEKNM